MTTRAPTPHAVSGPALEADVVVIGAGSAGLAAAAALAHPARRLRLVVLEPRTITPNGRRWLIAAEPGHGLLDLADTRFDSIALAGRRATLPRARIHHVRAAAFQQRALERLADSPLTRIEERVRVGEITGTPGAVTLETGLGRLTARAVIDTRPGSSHGVAKDVWTQIAYSGRIDGVNALPGVSLSRPFPDRGGVGLDQIVVLPSGEALIEAVRFAPPGQKGTGVEARAAALAEPLGADPNTLRLQRSVLPLTEPKAPARTDPAIAAGAGVGGLRFSVGTAAMRLSRWADGAAARFAETGRISAPPPPPAQARAANALALSRLQQGPEPAAAWLATVMEDAPPEAALRFLAGTPGWRDGRLALLRARTSA